MGKRGSTTNATTPVSAAGPKPAALSKRMPLKLPDPTRCHLWKQPKLVPEDLAGEHFDVIETYADDGHISRRLVKCKLCGQLYFREFYEEIDWRDGNDPQYTTLIPVKTNAQIEALKQLSLFELMDVLPQLRKDFPKEADQPKVYWIKKRPPCTN